MKRTDTSEQGLETTIFNAMLERGWIASQSQDYNREYAVDVVQLRSFLEATQPAILEKIALDDETSPIRREFLSRLQGEITKRGVIDVLRHGMVGASAGYNGCFRQCRSIRSLDIKRTKAHVKEL